MTSSGILAKEDMPIHVQQSKSEIRQLKLGQTQVVNLSNLG